MTPEARLFLDKAGVALAKADDVLAHWPDEAGRMAYLAGFHAAQAFISERTGKSAKTHRGVHAELHRLLKDDDRFDSDLRAFLGSSYTMKAVADYGTGPEAVWGAIYDAGISGRSIGATIITKLGFQARLPNTPPQTASLPRNPE